MSYFLNCSRRQTPRLDGQHYFTWHSFTCHFRTCVSTPPNLRPEDMGHGRGYAGQWSDYGLQWRQSLMNFFFLSLLNIKLLNSCIARQVSRFTLSIFVGRKKQVPIKVAAKYIAWIFFALSNTGIVGSNSTQGMNVCVHLFCVCVILCTSSGLAEGSSSVQGVLRPVYRIKKLKKWPSTNNGV
jgi:hypothetical protein